MQDPSETLASNALWSGMMRAGGGDHARFGAVSAATRAYVAFSAMLMKAQCLLETLTVETHRNHAVHENDRNTALDASQTAHFGNGRLVVE